MKKTVTLKVSLSTALARDHMALHPNEGFDLGLMRVEHPIRLCHSLRLEEYLKGGEGEVHLVNIELLNECPKETLLVGTGLHRILGEPAKAVILYDGHRLFIHGT
jgi:hypothetical protein